MKRLVASCSMLFLCVSFVFSNPVTSLSPEQILAQMVSTYATCNSYTDEGQVSTLFIQKLGNRTLIRPFSTAFIRPSEFRYEFKDRRGENEWNNYIVFMKGAEVKTFWSIQPGIKVSQDLSKAVAGASGVSGGSAHTVPAMLMPDLFGYHKFKMLNQLQLVGEEQIEGTTAYKIEGADSQGNKFSFWIDKDKLLLLKIYEKRKIKAQTSKIEDFETETTTTYKPWVNVTVASEKLEFNPTASQ